MSERERERGCGFGCGYPACYALICITIKLIPLERKMLKIRCTLKTKENGVGSANDEFNVSFQKVRDEVATNDFFST